jgi:hypothetical protein
MSGPVAVTNCGWKTIFTGSSAALNNPRWRMCLRIGSLASQAYSVTVPS